MTGPEVLLEVDGYRPVVVYRNGSGHHWSAEDAERAIAETMARHVRQDFDPRAIAEAAEDPFLARVMADFLGTDIDGVVTRWEVEDRHMEWVIPLALAHGELLGIEPHVPVRDVIPWGMNRQPTGASVGVHVDAKPDNPSGYKIDQVAVMARPALAGGTLTFHPPGRPDVLAPLEVGDVVIFDATIDHSVSVTEAGTRCIVTTSTCREVIDWWPRPAAGVAP